MRPGINLTESFLCHDNEWCQNTYGAQLQSVGATLKEIEFVFFLAQMSRINPNIVGDRQGKINTMQPKGLGMVWKEPYACRRALRLSTGYRSLSKCRWWRPVPPAGARLSTGTLSPSPRLCHCHEWSVACRAGEGRCGCTALQNKNKARQCSARAKSEGPLSFIANRL